MFARFLDWLVGRKPAAATIPAAAAATAAPLAVAEAAGLASADVAPALPFDGARHLMLAARLASVARLNGPKRQRAPASGADALSPQIPTARIGARKQRTSTGGPRIALHRPRRSAEIIPFPAARRQTVLRKAA